MNVSKNISSRLATPDDLLLYLNWANDPEVRANSFNSEAIKLENHRDWFLREVQNPRTLLLVFEYGGTPFGQTRFHSEHDQSLLNYSIDKEFRGQGLGAQMIDKALELLHESQPHIHSIIAKVKADNHSSIKVLERSGFAKHSEQEKEIVYIFDYGL